MTKPDLLEEGRIFFNAGRYYEAHEVWEDLWRETRGSLRRYYQGLIQAAVGLHHLSRNNGIGARSQLGKALRNLTSPLDEQPILDTMALVSQIEVVLKEMRPQNVRITRLK
jgi:predicted metal-dependent hydrolase